MSTDEIVILVDEADNVLGYKKRGELNLNDRWRISAVWIENSQGQVLLAQRAYDRKTDPGCWGPACAGTVNKDESYEENAIKELEEEIGVTDVEITLYKKQPYVSVRGNKRVCQWFNATLDWSPERFILQPEEVQAVAWFDKYGLADDIEAHPERYVGSAPFWIDLFELRD